MTSTPPISINALFEQRLENLRKTEPGLTKIVNYYKKREILYEELRNNPPIFIINPLEMILQAGSLVFKINEFPEGEPVWQVIWAKLSIAMESPEFSQLAIENQHLLKQGLSYVLLGQPDTADLFRGYDEAKGKLLTRDTFRPYFQIWRQQIQDRVDLDLDAWQLPVCPFCGHEAMLSELRGSQGARYLRCGLCGSGWAYPRLRCGLCGEEEYSKLSIIGYKDQLRECSIQTCDTCRGYLKNIPTFEAIPQELLVCEDLETLYLDTLANQQGYHRI